MRSPKEIADALDWLSGFSARWPGLSASTALQAWVLCCKPTVTETLSQAGEDEFVRARALEAHAFLAGGTALPILWEKAVNIDPGLW